MVPSGYAGIDLDKQTIGGESYVIIRKGELSAVQTTKGWRWNHSHPHDATTVGSVEAARKVLAENPQLR